MLFVPGVPRPGITCVRKVAKSVWEELVNSGSGAEKQQLEKGEIIKNGLGCDVNEAVFDCHNCKDDSNVRIVKSFTKG